MPEASSDLEMAAGKTTAAARRNANHMPGPMISAANVGVTKMPGSMADKEMITTPERPMVRANVALSPDVFPMWRTPISCTIMHSYWGQTAVSYYPFVYKPTILPGIRKISFGQMDNDLHFNCNGRGEGIDGQRGSCRSDLAKCFGPNLVVACKVSFHVN